MDITTEMPSGQSYGIVKRGMIAAILDDRLSSMAMGLQNREIGHITVRKKQRPIPPEPIGQSILEFAVSGSMPRKERRSAAPNAPLPCSRAPRFDDRWVSCKPEVVIRGKADQPTSLDHDSRLA